MLYLQIYNKCQMEVERWITKAVTLVEISIHEQVWTFNQNILPVITDVTDHACSESGPEFLTSHPKKSISYSTASPHCSGALLLFCRVPREEHHLLAH